MAKHIDLTTNLTNMIDPKKTGGFHSPFQATTLPPTYVEFPLAAHVGGDEPWAFRFTKKMWRPVQLSPGALRVRTEE